MRDLSALLNAWRAHLPDRSPRGIIREFPATIAITAIIATTSLATRGMAGTRYELLLSRIGMSYAEVWERDFWHLFTATFIQSEPGIGLGMLVLLLSGLALTELQIGTWRTVLTFFTADWVCTVVTATLLRGLVHLDIARITEGFHDYDAGSSAAGVATLAAGIVLLFPNRLARIALALLVAWNVASIGIIELGPAMVHTVAVAVGALYAQVIWRHPIAPRLPTSFGVHRVTDAQA